MRIQSEMSLALACYSSICGCCGSANRVRTRGRSGTAARSFAFAAGLIAMLCLVSVGWLVATVNSDGSSVQGTDSARDASLPRLTAAEYQRECARLRGVQQWERLEGMALRWSQAEPKRLEPWLMAAEAARSLGALDRVAAHLQSAPADSPPDLLVILAELQMNELQRPSEAEATLQRLVERFPHDVETHLQLIQYYAMTCQRDKLIKQTEQCIQSGIARPEVFAHRFAARWLLLSNGFDLNQEWMQKASTAEASEQQVELFDVAGTIHLFAHPDLKEMTLSTRSPSLVPTEYYETQLDQALQRYPANLELLAGKLRLRAYAGDTTTVARLLAGAPQSSADDPRFWYFAGWLQAATDHLAEAVQSLDKSLQLDPFDWWAWQELAHVKRRLDSVEAAAPFQSRAAEGKRLYEAIRAAPAMSSLDAETYQRLAGYLRDCGSIDLAERLQICLSSWRGNQ